jgi:ribosomal protein L11 methyltransferase
LHSIFKLPNSQIIIQYEFFTKDESKRDFIISLLPEVGFDGFEEQEESVKAFIPKESWDQEAILDILAQNELGNIEFKQTDIAPKNWNEEWEKNFEPVIIAGRVGIRAPFHATQGAEYELIIEPKMSFGTGHHATTSLMIQQMLAMDMKGKTVADFGCGTGILAIMAEKLGAASVVAIDHEEWAVENSKENLGRNNAVKVTVLFADSMDSSQARFDIMLANINRNVIMKSLQSWRNFLRPGGVLVVSGILVTDTDDVSVMAVSSGFLVEKVLTENGWASILFKSN